VRRAGGGVVRGEEGVRAGGEVRGTEHYWPPGLHFQSYPLHPGPIQKTGGYRTPTTKIRNRLTNTLIITRLIIIMNIKRLIH